MVRRLALYLPWLMILAATVPEGATVVYDGHMIGCVLIGAFVVLVVSLLVTYLRKAARGERW